MRTRMFSIGQIPDTGRNPPPDGPSAGDSSRKHSSRGRKSTRGGPWPAWRSTRPLRSTRSTEAGTTCDLVLIMSVNPGFGGQSFIPQSLEKLRPRRALLPEASRSRSTAASTTATPPRWSPPAPICSSPGRACSTGAIPRPLSRARRAAAAPDPSGDEAGRAPRLEARRARAYTAATKYRCLQGGVKVPTGGESPRASKEVDQVEIPGPTVTVRMEEDARRDSSRPWSTRAGVVVHSEGPTYETVGRSHWRRSRSPSAAAGWTHPNPLRRRRRRRRTARSSAAASTAGPGKPHAEVVALA